jgi:hypothetical protein
MSKELPFKITVENVNGGVNVTIEATDGMKIDLIDQTTQQTDRITLHIRDFEVPRIGSRVKVSDGTMVKVLSLRYDGDGHLWVLDEDTRVWHHS